jgi:hypothetical protein
VRKENHGVYRAHKVRKQLHREGDRVAHCHVARLIRDPGFRGVRDEFLNGEIVYTLKEAQILVANWRRPNYGPRPHSSQGDACRCPRRSCYRDSRWPNMAPPSSAREVALRPT